MTTLKECMEAHVELCSELGWDHPYNSKASTSAQSEEPQTQTVQTPTASGSATTSGTPAANGTPVTKEPSAESGPPAVRIIVSLNF